MLLPVPVVAFVIVMLFEDTSNTDIPKISALAFTDAAAVTGGGGKDAERLQPAKHGAINATATTATASLARTLVGSCPKPPISTSTF